MKIGVANIKVTVECDGRRLILKTLITINLIIICNTALDPPNLKAVTEPHICLMFLCHTCFFCREMSVLHFILIACFIVLRDTGDGGLTISSPSFVFQTGGSLVSFATMEKSKS